MVKFCSLIAERATRDHFSAAKARPVVQNFVANTVKDTECDIGDWRPRFTIRFAKVLNWLNKKRLIRGCNMRMKLKEARMRAGLTQAQAGALIGKTQSHFGKIERGTVMIQADEALVLCEALSLGLADLLQVDA